MSNADKTVNTAGAQIDLTNGCMQTPRLRVEFRDRFDPAGHQSHSHRTETVGAKAICHSKTARTCGGKSYGSRNRRTAVSCEIRQKSSICCFWQGSGATRFAFEVGSVTAPAASHALLFGKFILS